MATCSQLQTWLTAAETAMHQVAIGSKVEVTQYGTKSITYTRANLGELKRYVAELRDQVAACTGDSTRRKRRVFGIIPS